MTTFPIPNAEAETAIRRGLADVDAGRKVTLDEAVEHWLPGAEVVVPNKPVSDIVYPIIGILGIAVLARFIYDGATRRIHIEPEPIPDSDRASERESQSERARKRQPVPA